MTLLTRLGLAALVLLIMTALPACQRSPSTPTACDVVIAGRTFHLELALDDATRARGLAHRTGIAPDGGMLFVFPNAQVRQFWMKDCLVPIDIAFLDGAGWVMATHEMSVEPAEVRSDSRALVDRNRFYSSQGPAQFAIELAGGTLRQLNVSRGQRIAIRVDDLKRLAR